MPALIPNCAQHFPFSIIAGGISFVLRDFLIAAEALRRLELSVMVLKHRKVTLAQTQNPAPGMLDHARRLEHHLVHHRPDAAAFGAMAHRGVGFIERVLPNHSQQVHRQGGKLAHKIVDVKFARGQPLQIHVSLERGMLTWGFAKLLMRSVIAVQGNDLSRAKFSRQRGRRLSLRYVLGQPQVNATLVNRALGEAIDTLGRVTATSHIGQVQTFLPDALTLAGAQRFPLRGGISRFLACNGLDWRATRIPLDDESELAFEFNGLPCHFLHQLERAKARIGEHQQRACRQTGGHWQGALKAVFTRTGRMLHSRAQCQFQAVSQIHRKRAVAIHTHIGATDQFLLGKIVIYGEGVQINWGVATVQRTEVDGLVCNALTQQPVVDLRNQIKPLPSKRIQTLAPGWAGGDIGQVQRTFEEVVVSEVFDGIKVVLAQAQQGDVGLVNIAVGDTCSDGAGRIEQGFKFGGLEILTNQRQIGVRTEVVGEFFDNEVVHDRIHL